MERVMMRREGKEKVKGIGLSERKRERLRRRREVR